MLNILVILLFSIVFLILLSILYFYKKRYQRLAKTTKSFGPSTTYLKQQKFNPDINTDNWDLHKLRLEKFRRSQYKGLTFFKSSEDKIYYLSEKGIKVYC